MTQDLKKIPYLVDQFADRWTLLVLKTLGDSEGRARFIDLKNQIENIAQKTLAQTLRRLERNGIIERVVIEAELVTAQYSLTTLGRSLESSFKPFYVWGETHEREVTLAQGHFDARPTPRKE